MAQPSNQNELQVQYNRYKNTLQQIAQKIGELESERDEHNLVIETLKPLDGDRMCFRMVGGVLVERTVKEVLPALDKNSQGISNVLKQLNQEYTKTENEFKTWQTKNKIQVVHQ